MELFTKKDFEFNRSWGVFIAPYRDEFILYITDVYKRPRRVTEYLKQCPIKSHKDVTPNSRNGKDFIDGQVYVNNAWDDARAKLFDKIIEFYQIKIDPNMAFPPMSMYNQFRMITDHPGDDHFFCPHIDDQSVNTINCVTYLNPDAGPDYGTVLYKEVEGGRSGKSNEPLEHEEPWHKSGIDYIPDLSIISVYNSMVVFPGTIPHGQNITDNRFKEETRLTEVAFF
tara:strand:- start:47 stop:724 length:678 start_codon:yes stop_codon:yes gene_type:complete